MNLYAVMDVYTSETCIQPGTYLLLFNKLYVFDITNSNLLFSNSDFAIPFLHTWNM